jgi:hypothetical protein
LQEDLNILAATRLRPTVGALAVNARPSRVTLPKDNEMLDTNSKGEETKAVFSKLFNDLRQQTRA